MDRKVSARVRAQRWYVRFPRAVPFGLFALVLAITLLSVAAIERGEQEREMARTKDVAVQLASALKRRADAHSAYLRAGAILFSGREQASQAAFRAFAVQSMADRDLRGAEGMGWGQRVERRAIPAFDAAMTARTGRPYAVHPVGASLAAAAVPVTYLHPETVRNRRAMGYDMYSEPIRRAAMDAAVRHASPTASGRLVLVQEGPLAQRPGFIIYMPVFADGVAGGALKGFIYSPFNARTLLNSSFDLERVRGYSVQLRDGPGGAILAGHRAFTPSGKVLKVPLTLANRRMELLVEGPRAAWLSERALLTLGFGLLVASLLTVLARMATRQAAEDREALTWLEEQVSIRNSLTRELNHRVKNTLANVLSIVALTRRRASSLDEFVEGLNGRIRALSATHDLLTVSEWGVTPVRAVIEAELSPYARGDDHEVSLAGPDVELAPNDALTLGLALHELATNAAKYGALSVEGGQVAVRWHLLSPDLVRIEWVERGGPDVPDVADGRGRGFGTDLIEKIVAHELRHPVDLRFPPEGVECQLTVPVRAPRAFRVRTR